MEMGNIKEFWNKNVKVNGVHILVIDYIEKKFSYTLWLHVKNHFREGA